LKLPRKDGVGPPVIIRADTLQLDRQERGYRLEFSGRPARGQINDVIVEGRTVGLDQDLGVAWVEGAGAMSLPADSTLDGRRLAEPGRLHISWGSHMFFNGSVAEFGGGVHVMQGQSKLQCGRLEAYFEKRIELAEPADDEEPKAQVEKLVCAEHVILTNTVMRDGLLEKQEQIEAETVTFDKASQQLIATGPGVVRTITRGPMARSSQTAEAGGESPEEANRLYLTRISFRDRMEAHRETGAAAFSGQVELIHSPIANVDETLDPDHLPEGALVLVCQQLEVGAKRAADGSVWHELIGVGDVQVEAREFRGVADRISYHQLHDRLIFEATRPGSQATLWHQARLGMQPNVFRARKFYYRRRTGEIRIEEGSQFQYQRIGAATGSEQSTQQ